MANANVQNTPGKSKLSKEILFSRLDKLSQKEQDAILSILNLKIGLSEKIETRAREYQDLHNLAFDDALNIVDSEIELRHSGELKRSKASGEAYLFHMALVKEYLDKGYTDLKEINQLIAEDNKRVREQCYS